jgi:hypothetical protein
VYIDDDNNSNSSSSNNNGNNNNKYEGEHSGENKRKMAREEDAWTIAT